MEDLYVTYHLNLAIRSVARRAIQMERDRILAELDELPHDVLPREDVEAIVLGDEGGQEGDREIEDHS